MPGAESEFTYRSSNLSAVASGGGGRILAHGRTIRSRGSRAAIMPLLAEGQIQVARKRREIRQCLSFAQKNQDISRGELGSSTRPASLILIPNLRDHRTLNAGRWTLDAELEDIVEYLSITLHATHFSPLVLLSGFVAAAGALAAKAANVDRLESPGAPMLRLPKDACR